MNKSIASGGETFKEQELVGWDAKAAAYDDLAGKITRQIVDPLLDAAAVGEGLSVLDIACGPGHMTGAIARRGARAVGIDFAPSMVAQARKNFPGVEFFEGDAEALQFKPNGFDAVVCAFGIGHLPNAEKGIAEAYRVLRPGGRYAFSWWCAPDKHEFFAVLLNAIKTHGTLDVPLPPSPPMFRFSDPAECRRTLMAAGFVDVQVAEHPLAHAMTRREEVLEFLQKSSVRAAMILELQSQEALPLVNAAILAGVKPDRNTGGFRIGWPAVVASARKPA